MTTSAPHRPTPRIRSALLLSLAAAAFAEDTPAPVPAPAPATPVEQGEKLVVEGERESPYLPAARVTSGKTDVPLLEDTRRVDTITEQQMWDLGATRSNELWRLVPNAIEGERGTVVVRGFDLGQGPAAGAQLFDGVRTSAYNLVPVNLANVERVEMLKGPSGVMYGQGQPGGMVNYVLKKPQETRSISVSTALNSFGKRQIGIDATGALSRLGEGTLSFRVTGTAEHSKTFRTHETIDNASIAPSLAWRADNGISVTLLTEVFEDTRTGGRGYGTPVRQGNPFAMPRDYGVTDPDDYRDLNGADAQLQTHVPMGESLAFDMTLFAMRSLYENAYHEGQRNAAEDAADTPIYRRQYRVQSSDTKAWGYDAHLAWEQSKGAFANRSLIGTDLTIMRDPQFPAIDGQTTNPQSPTNPDGALPVDLDHPGSRPGDVSGYGIDADAVTTARVRNIGVYLQHRIGLMEQVFIDGGVRFDRFREETDTLNRLTGARTLTDADDHDLSFNGGTTWKFTEVSSIYYCYSEGFRPQGWTSVNNPNGPFPPLTWDQNEVGLQAETPDKDLAGTFTVFQINRDHELIPDTSPGAPSGASVDAGKTRSRGLETSLTGTLGTRTSLTLVGGLTDAYVRDSSVAAIGGGTITGAKLAGVPRYTAGALMAQEVPDTRLRLSLSWNYVGTRGSRTDTNDPLSFTLPAYQVLGAGVSYLADTWRVRLGVDNLLDDDYVTVYRSPAHAVNRGDPRTLTLNASATF